uniref:Uncharacterized protein n=1 Tax=Tanacetum cinerariifolium TaxID=118510 RepID=A0A6L2K571_TANCI|nr:hypothetical protein [Tanacetum cinerariifolium]
MLFGILRFNGHPSVMKGFFRNVEKVWTTHKVQTSLVLDDWGTNLSDSKNELSLSTFSVINEMDGSGGVGLDPRTEVHGMSIHQPDGVVSKRYHIVPYGELDGIQATIQDGRVTVQQVQWRQGQSYAGSRYKGNATSFEGNNTGGRARVVKCYNCQDEEQLAFFADLGIPDGQANPTNIPNNDAFQTEDLDAYDSDSNDVSTVQVALMANLSNYGSDVILEYLILNPITMI